MIEVGQVRPYKDKTVNGMQSVAMLVVAIDGDTIKARPAESQGIPYCLTYARADFERWYPVVAP